VLVPDCAEFLTALPIWRSRGEEICHSKGGLKVYRIVHWHTDNQFAFCEPFQKNLWESVNCTYSIKVSVEYFDAIL
jgi:hypothetical protein